MYRDLVVKLISFEGVTVSDTLGLPRQYSVKVPSDLSSSPRSLYTITSNYDQSFPDIRSHATRWLDPRQTSTNPPITNPTHSTLRQSNLSPQTIQSRKTNTRLILHLRIAPLNRFELLRHSRKNISRFEQGEDLAWTDPRTAVETVRQLCQPSLRSSSSDFLNGSVCVLTANNPIPA
jgi:hypothetical protein